MHIFFVLAYTIFVLHTGLGAMDASYPLHGAAAHGNLEEVKKLIHMGACPKQKDLTGHTAVQIALKNKHLHLAKLIIESMQRGGQLVHAAETNDVAAVKTLLQTDVCPNITDTKGNTAIHNAILSGNEEIITLLLDHQGVDINAQNERLDTPLHLLASQQSNQDMLRSIFPRLMEKNCNVNLQNQDGYTALHTALMEFNNVMVALLAQLAITDINAQSPEDGYTPLHIAAAVGNHEGIAIVLNRKDVEAHKPSKENSTPLLNAIFNECADTVSLLLKHSSTKPYIAQNALHAAIDMDQAVSADILSLLINNHKINVNDEHPTLSTPLIHAITKNQEDAIELLMNHDAIDLYKHDSSGRSPLLMSLWHTDTSILEKLIDAGFDWNKNRTPYDSLVAFAKENTHSDAQKNLINLLTTHMKKKPLVETEIAPEKNNKKKTKSKQKTTPTHAAKKPVTQTKPKTLCDAIINGDLRLCKIIIDQNPACINEIDTTHGQTPLHLALKIGQVNIADFLLQQESLDTNILNFSDQSPLHVALISSINDTQKRALVDALIPKTKSALYQKIADDAHAKTYPLFKIIQKQIKENLRSTTNVEPTIIKPQKPQNPFTNLLEAIRVQDIQEMQNILDEDSFDINLTNTTDQGGKTALHHACQIGNEAMCTTLIKRGASVHKTVNDIQKNTPLHLACEYGHSNLVATLLDHGADQNAKNENNKTALERAIATHHPECARVVSAYESIHQACRTGYKRAINFHLKNNGIMKLFEQGAKDSRRDNTGSLPLCLAASHLHSDVLQMLFNYVLAQENGSTLLAQLIAQTDCTGRTLLHWLADPKQETLKTCPEKFTACLDVLFDNALLGYECILQALRDAVATRDKAGYCPAALIDDQNGLAALKACLEKIA